MVKFISVFVIFIVLPNYSLLAGPKKPRSAKAQALINEARARAEAKANVSQRRVVSEAMCQGIYNTLAQLASDSMKSDEKALSSCVLQVSRESSLSGIEAVLSNWAFQRDKIKPTATVLFDILAPSFISA